MSASIGMKSTEKKLPTMEEKIHFWLRVYECEEGLKKAGVPEEFWRYDIPKEYH